MADDCKSEIDVPADRAIDKFPGDNTGLVTLSDRGGRTQESVEDDSRKRRIKE